MNTYSDDGSEWMGRWSPAPSKLPTTWRLFRSGGTFRRAALILFWETLTPYSQKCARIHNGRSLTPSNVWKCSIKGGVLMSAKSFLPFITFRCLMEKAGRCKSHHIGCVRRPPRRACTSILYQYAMLYQMDTIYCTYLATVWGIATVW